MSKFYCDNEGRVYHPGAIKKIFLNNNWILYEDNTGGGYGCQYKLSFTYDSELVEIYCTTGTVNTTVNHYKHATVRHMLVFYNTDMSGLREKAKRGVRTHTGWDHWHRDEYMGG